MNNLEEFLPAREIAIREFNSLRGRLCTVIEAAGMDRKQERAMVTLIKNLSYQNQAVIAELIQKLEEAYGNMESQNGMGSNGLQFRYTEDKLEK